MQLQVSKGSTRKLPGQSFSAGLGWDPVDTNKPVDLDLWIIRNNGGTFEPVCWANTDFARPDLGHNSEGNPFIATPELDVIHRGDDRTGEESSTGYDENATLDVSKAPAGVSQYQIWGSIWNEEGANSLIGEATNVVFGVKEEATGHELVVKLADEHPWDTSVLLCTIDRNPDGTWSMTSKQEGTSDGMLVVSKALGIA